MTHVNLTINVSDISRQIESLAKIIGLNHGRSIGIAAHLFKLDPEYASELADILMKDEGETGFEPFGELVREQTLQFQQALRGEVTLESI